MRWRWQLNLLGWVWGGTMQKWQHADRWAEPHAHASEFKGVRGEDNHDLPEHEQDGASDADA